MAITIKDIAKEAGVSISTVSKVINGAPSISQATIDNIHAIMERLEYIPNQRAANLARATTRNIAFLTTLKKGQAFDHPHMFDIICGVQNELDKIGYALTLVDASRDKKIGDTAKRIILQKSADGIIIHDVPINKAIADFIVNKEFPHIVVGKPDFDHSISWTNTNNILSGEIAARHLLKCGYHQIAFIGRMEEYLISTSRLKGVISGLREKNVKLKEDFICQINHDVKESYDAMISLIKKHPQLDAVICENNLIAVGVTKALLDNNISIPDEMGIIMIDDNPYSKVIVPMPTVVNIDVYDLGIQITKNLMLKIKNPALQIQTYTTLPELILRGTTK